MTRRPRPVPTRTGRRTVLKRAAGLAAAGLAIDAATTHELVAAVQRAVPAVDWLWSGAVTSGSARVRARVTIEGPARLIVTRGDGRDAASPRIVEPTGPPSTDGVRTFDVDGLQADTAYRYAIETAAGRDERTGRFHTFADGPFSFAFAFGSCASTGSNNRIFDTIRGRAPHFFLHLGDFHYENISVDDPWRFREASNRVLRSPRQSALYRAAPIVYIFDDHDYGLDDSDGTSVTKASAQRVYRERVPHYPLPLSAALNVTAAGTGPIAQAFTVGRARVIVTDTRSERTPQRARDADTRTMLGPAQRQWFVNELTRAADEKAPVVFWANTVPWITKENPQSGHGWEPYAHERAEIAGTISKLGLTSRLIVLSGDAHMAAIDDGTNSNYVAGTAPSTRGFVVMQAAPFSRFPRSKGGPYSHGRSTRNHQFGWVEVKDTGDAVTVELTARNQTGGVIPGLQLTVKPT